MRHVNSIDHEDSEHGDAVDAYTEASESSIDDAAPCGLCNI